MPVEKEKIPAWAGFGVPRQDSNLHPRFMLCGAFPISYVHNKPLARLIRCFHSWRVVNAFRLSQAYALIIAHDTAEKLAKFQNKKAGQSLPPVLLSL